MSSHRVHAMTSTIPCPTCGLGLSLSYEYLSQYGGQITSCPTCRQPFTLPLAADVFGAAPPAMQPMGGAPVSGSPPPMPVLGYAGPALYQGGAGGSVFRDGNRVVAANMAQFPY